MKKMIIKILCFAGIFILLWMLASHVLNNDIRLTGVPDLRYKDLEDEKSTDVIYLGASNIYCGVSPVLVWNETGMTGFSLGVNSGCAMLFYYELKYLLEHHDASLVVFDVAGLSTEKDPASFSESPFRKVYMSLPDPKLKAELMDDICAHWEDFDPMLYYFPLLRYHERWTNLEEKDFNKDLWEFDYKPFAKGCRVETDIEKQKLRKDFFLYERDSAQEVHMEYLEKIYELCRENDIELMLVSCPRVHVYYADYCAAKEFAKEHELNFLSFTTKEEFEELDLDLKKDFIDAKHLNLFGQKKFSEYLAAYIEEHYSLEDRRSDPEIAEEWNQAYEDHMAFYNETKASLES